MFTAASTKFWDQTESSGALSGYVNMLMVAEHTPRTTSQPFLALYAVEPSPAL